MSIYVFAIIAIVFVANASFQDQIKGISSYNKIDIAGIMLNIILSIFYLSLYVICNIVFSASDKPYENQFEGIKMAFSHLIEFAIPLICIISIALSVKLRKMGKSIASFYIQFFPMVLVSIKYFFFI
jgi:heme/copper-type cytochrome/quinol oxidase subunit 2